MSVMLSTLTDLLARMQSVHIATTDAQRQAIFRLRYRIYVDEQRDDRIADVDHDAGLIRSSVDVEPQTLLFYIGASDRPYGTLRVRCFTPGTLPRTLQEAYSTHRFTDLHTRTVCEVSTLMVVPAARRTPAVISLTMGAIEHCIEQHGVEMMFANCAPGLLAAYQRLGLRPYGGRLIHATRGLQIPLVAISSDLAHLRRVGSPWYPGLRRLASRGALPQRDIQPLLDVIEGSRDIHTDVSRITVALSEVEPASTLLERLPEVTRRRLSKEGFVVPVEADTEVFEAGLVERDLYIILDGVFEVHRDSQHLATLSRGDLFGEVAFFRESGERSASVRSLTAGRLLIVRHRFLARLRKNHPEEAFSMMEALAGLLADRLADRR